MTGPVYRAGCRHKCTLPRAAPAQQTGRANQEEVQEGNCRHPDAWCVPTHLLSKQFCSQARALLHRRRPTAKTRFPKWAPIFSPGPTPWPSGAREESYAPPQRYEAQPGLARCSCSLTQAVLPGLEVHGAVLVLAQRLPLLPLCQSNPTGQRCSEASVARAPHSSHPRTSQNATPPHKGQQPGRAAGGRPKKPIFRKASESFLGINLRTSPPPRAATRTNAGHSGLPYTGKESAPPRDPNCPSSTGEGQRFPEG